MNARFFRAAEQVVELELDDGAAIPPRFASVFSCVSRGESTKTEPVEVPARFKVAAVFDSVFKPEVFSCLKENRGLVLDY